MAVISAQIPTRNSARLNVRALALGTEVDVIDVDGDETFVDLSGTAEKCLLTLLTTGATVLEVTNYTGKGQQAAWNGQEGEGIPNHGESAYDRTARLMGKPKF